MKRDKPEKRLRAFAYGMTTIFIALMLLPLLYVVSLSLQGEYAIYNYPPNFLPPIPRSVSITLDYSPYADLPQAELEQLLLRDSTLALYGTIYRLDKEDIGEIKVYGTMNGQDIFYTRAHGLNLKTQISLGVYRDCRIASNILLQDKRYPKSAEIIGYVFAPEGTGKAPPGAPSEQGTIVQGVTNCLTGEYQTQGALANIGVSLNPLLLLENFVYYYKLPQMVYTSVDAIRNYSFFAFIGQTVITVGWTMLCQVFIPAFTAYPLAKLMKKKTANWVMLFFLATMMIPFVVVMIPQLLLMKGLGLMNTLPGMLLPALVPAPFSIFLYKGFFDRIAPSYFEAARIDGANEFYTFFNICLPMSKPILLLMALQAFIWGWGDFMWYYLVGNKPELWTLNVAIYTFSQMTKHIKQNFLMGLSLITILPVLVLAAVFSKQIKAGVVGSGLKE